LKANQLFSPPPRQRLYRFDHNPTRRCGREVTQLARASTRALQKPQKAGAHQDLSFVPSICRAPELSEFGLRTSDTTANTTLPKLAPPELRQFGHARQGGTAKTAKSPASPGTRGEPASNITRARAPRGLPARPCASEPSLQKLQKARTSDIPKRTLRDGA
jgi:hypothetical protein